eukprot:maker-scaffold571_size134521-snap-gene-0.13 protein:Tk11006 transcript:maker-scaffold571_size134521-snap-gene-0.13-mRNA-1 annotation:"hypothetical protein SINV_12653"
MKWAILITFLLVGAALADHSNNQGNNRDGRVIRNRRPGRNGQQAAGRRNNNAAPIRFNNIPSRKPLVGATVVPVPIPGSSNSGGFQPHTAPIPVPTVPSHNGGQAPRGGKQLNIPGAVVVNNAPNENGEYNFQYQTDDGVSRQESGQTILSGNEEINEITGQVSWTSPEGELVTLNYVANENGFQPTGSHVPVGPNLQDLPLAIRLGQELIQRVAARDAAKQG